MNITPVSPWCKGNNLKQVKDTATLHRCCPLNKKNKKNPCFRTVSVFYTASDFCLGCSLPVFQSPPLYFFFFFFLSKISLLLIARSLNYDVTVTSKVRLRVTLTLRPTAEQRSYDILFPIPVFSATIFVCYCVVVAAAAVAVVAMLVLYVRLLSVFTT